MLTFIITSSKSKINKVLSYCASSVFVIQSQFSLVGKAPQPPRTSPAEMASPSFGTLKKRRPFSYKKIRERRFRSTDRCISSSPSQDMSPAEDSAHPFVIPSSCFLYSCSRVYRSNRFFGCPFHAVVSIFFISLFHVGAWHHYCSTLTGHSHASRFIGTS